MATSRTRWPAYFGSRAHLLGSGGGGLGLVVALLAHTGGWGAAVVAGLYGAGAVLGLAFPPPPAPLAPLPPPPHPPGPPQDEVLAARLHEELAAQHDRVAQADWPEPDARTARLLVHGVGDRVGPLTAAGLREVVGSVVPAELDRYERASAWQRLEPGDPPPGAEFAARVRLVLEKLP